MFVQNQDLSFLKPNSPSRQYDDSPTIKRQKVVQFPCNNKIDDKKSN